MIQETQENNSEKSTIRGCLETIGLILLIVASLGAVIYGGINEDMKFVGISFICSFALFVIYVTYRRKMKENEDKTATSIDPFDETRNYLGTPISERYANNIYDAVRSFSEFLTFVHYRTDDLYVWIESQHLPSSKGKNMEQSVHSMILSDMQTGFISMECPLDLKSKEGLALYSVIDYFNTGKHYDFEDIPEISEDDVQAAQKQAEDALNTFNPDHEENKLFLPELLKNYDEDAHIQYLIALYRFFSLTAKADNVVTEKESVFLKQVMARTHVINANVDITKDIIYSIDTMKELWDLHPYEVVSIGEHIVKNKRCKTTEIRDLFECSDTQFYLALNKLKKLKIIKIDGIDCEALVDEVDFVRILRGQKSAKTKQKSPKQTSTYRPETTSDEPAINQLDKLIGLASVKKDVKTLANFVKIQKQRESKGLKASSASYHCVFTGNPGTGKTTVARIVANIYKELGVLREGHLVETDRSGLVAEYVGQTAVKTNKIINSAIDGVLFIDEAYTLAEGGSSDYGSEAIATLLKRMEDDRDHLVVIIAGYTKNMKNFIDSNPGLQSRFTRYIEFPDYSADELMQIFEMNMRKYDYHFGEGAKEQLQQVLDDAIAHKDENFGNGRFVRNIFEKVLQHQADRLASESNLTTEQLSSIEKEDLADVK